jgi:hypothetical protein
MIPELSDQQRRVLQEHPGVPVRVLDSVTQSTYVLVSQSAYDRVRALFEDDPFEPHELSSLMNEVAATQGWDDPAMDAYDALDPRRNTP